MIDGGGGPFGPNPLAMLATLIAQPAIQGQRTLVGRGNTFLVSGGGQFAGAFNKISMNQFL